MRYTKYLNQKLYLHPVGDVVCDHIMKNGTTEEHLVYIFKQYIKPNFIVLEGGSHVGVHTIRFSTLASEGHVYSFEASKRNYDLLERTIQENQIQNITLQHKALYSNNEIVYLKESFAPDQDSVSNQQTPWSVEGITIDNLNIPHIDFIKLDIEGGELKALMGAVDTLQRCKPIITFEYLKHLNAQSPIPFLIDNGYDVFEMEGHWDYLALPKQ